MACIEYRIKNTSLWTNLLTILIMGICHVALSRWKTDECEAIASELHALEKEVDI